MWSLTKLKKKKNSGGGDVGKAVQGKKGLDSPGLFFSFRKEHQRAWQMAETVDHLEKKEKPPYLVFFYSLPQYVFLLCGQY